MRRSEDLLKKMSDSISRTVAVLCVICTVFMLASCTHKLGIHESVSDAGLLPQPNPYDGISFMTKAKLYYRFLDSAYLLPLEVDVKIQSNEMEEAAVLRALIAGTGKGDIYTSSIPSSTEIVNMMENGDTLYVTLNRDFIDNKNYRSTSDKRIAVCEVLNTLSNYSKYSVQILIDMHGNGIGERVSYTDLGFESTGKNKTEYASSFIFTKSMVATPDLMFSYCMEHLKANDFAGAAVMFTDTANKQQVSGSDVKKLFTNRVLTAFTPPVISENGSTVTVTTSVTIMNTATNEEIGYENIKLNLVAYGEIYKISFDEFAAAIGA